jgi:Zn-dependent M28 family amino/carboxypeptidase
MGQLYRSAFLVVLSTLLAGATPLTATQAQASTAAVPSADSLMRHVYALADDSVRGRGTGTEGYDMAARYVAEWFRQHAIAPAPHPRGFRVEYYFHQFYFELPRSLSSAQVRSYNVVAFVPGTDRQRASEHVVVGAHLDHVGVQGRRIFNGASDNASGVAVLLEVARLVAARPASRTVVFAAFGAEEYGHHGSLAFVEEAAAAGRRVVANINIDDVGHLSTVDAGRPSLAALHGKSICLELYNIVRARGNENGIEITDIDHSNLFTHSDHYSFYRAGIPVLDFGAGFLSDWLHTPEDDPDAMDGHQLQQVATVVYESVRTIAEHIDMCKSR